MRLPAAAASILVIGLVAAACGGDDATPEPAEESTPAPAATASGGETAEEPTEAAVTETEFATRAQLTSEDDPEATYALTSGRYRMQWNATDCEQVDLLVKQVDGDFEYPKPSRSSFASATINDLPEGLFTVQQLDPDCTEWSVRIDRMSD
jgi:hypothetical protein